MMSRFAQIVCFLFFLSAFTAYPQAANAVEDGTAHITFKKTEISKLKTATYKVKEGEKLPDIINEKFAPSPEKRKKIYSLIKRLNPGIKNFNKLETGQELLFPEKYLAEARKQTGASTYIAKKGDFITRILYRQLGLKGNDLQQALRKIKQLNPHIRNINLVYPGQAIKLPGKEPAMASQKETIQEAETKKPAEAPVETKTEEKATTVLPSAKRLAAIRHILARMNGTMTTSGLYYIPLGDLGQATIDCADIPVVELDDGSIVLLDFAERIPEQLKKFVQGNWGNTSIVKLGKDDAIAAILNKTVNASKTYKMGKWEKTIFMADKAQIAYELDWIISKKNAADAKPYMQGLSFIKDSASRLPPGLISIAEQNGISITEIENENIVTTREAAKTVPPETPVLPSNGNKQLILSLLRKFNQKIETDKDLQIFTQKKDGFNLSVRADIIVDLPKTGIRSAAAETETGTDARADADKKESAGWGVILATKSRTNIRGSRSLKGVVKGQLEAGQTIKGDFLKSEWYAVFKQDETERSEKKALGYVYAPRFARGAGTAQKQVALKAAPANTRVLFNSRPLPKQFINILREKGIALILINSSAPRRTLVEQTLRAIDIPCTSGRYTFTIPEKGSAARASLSFPAIKSQDESAVPLYLIDFNLEPDISGLLYEKWKLNFLKY